MANTTSLETRRTASLVVSREPEPAQIFIEQSDWNLSFQVEDIRTSRLLLALAQLVGDESMTKQELYSFLEGSEGMALHIIQILAEKYSFTPQMIAQLMIDVEESYRRSLGTSPNRAEIVNVVERKRKFAPPTEF